MSAPEPYTDNELAERRREAEACGCYTCKPQLRLLATVDAERARREQAEAALTLADAALRDHPMQAFSSAAAQRRRAQAIDVIRRAQPYPDDPGARAWMAEQAAARRFDASPTEGNPE